MEGGGGLPGHQVPGCGERAFGGPSPSPGVVLRPRLSRTNPPPLALRGFLAHEIGERHVGEDPFRGPGVRTSLASLRAQTSVPGGSEAETEVGLHGFQESVYEVVLTTSEWNITAMHRKTTVTRRGCQQSARGPAVCPKVSRGSGRQATT